MSDVQYDWEVPRRLARLEVTATIRYLVVRFSIDPEKIPLHVVVNNC